MAQSHQLRVPTPMELCCRPRLPFKPPLACGTAPPCKSEPALRARSCLGTQQGQGSSGHGAAAAPLCPQPQTSGQDPTVPTLLPSHPAAAFLPTQPFSCLVMALASRGASAQPHAFKLYPTAQHPLDGLRPLTGDPQGTLWCLWSGPSGQVPGHGPASSPGLQILVGCQLPGLPTSRALLPQTPHLRV